MAKLTYKKSGVDVKKAARFMRSIAPLAKKTRGSIGGFGGLYPFPKGYKNPFLVSSSDGVGTKLKLAFLMNKHDTVGIDLVAMNVNDILTLGAKPLLFLDYIACGKLKTKTLISVVRGVAAGCKQAGCVLAGGETAEMPGFYKDGEYDLAGFCTGVVEKSKIIDGSTIKPGDAVIGIASSGPHSNGYSLIRKALSKKLLRKYAKELLAPTKIYVKPVLALASKIGVKGIAHITGGSFQEKLPRILPKGVSLVINKGSWKIPKIFDIIQKAGRISDKSMYSTFNMGVGMILVVAPKDAAKTIRELARQRTKAWIIGEAIKGNGQVRIVS